MPESPATHRATSRMILPTAIVIALGAASLSTVTALHRARSVTPHDSSKDAPAIRSSLAKMPLYFIENKGQVDPQVNYYVQGSRMSAYFTPEGVTLALTAPAGRLSPAITDRAGPQAAQRWAVRQQFVGADPSVRPRGHNRTDAVVSYFKGSPNQWKTAIPTHSSVAYKNLWPGIDLAYQGTGGQLKYTFLIHPGADVDQIRLAYEGAQSVRITAAGELQVTTPVGGFREGRPVAWQAFSGGRTPVTAEYNVTAPGSYTFRLGSYDHSRPLVLDPPVVIYGGFIGGSGDDADDEEGGIAVDGAGAAYVTSYTNSADFPAAVGPDTSYNGSYDAFVAKVKPNGTGLVYAGFIGGTSGEIGYAIAVDTAGAAYVAGSTNSSSFPATVGPGLSYNANGDGFVAKVKPDGTDLVYAGYIGSSGEDAAIGVDVDSSGAAYVVGNTDAASFPSTVGPDLSHNGGSDAFVAKVKPNGTGLTYSGFIGGSADDYANGVAVHGGRLTSPALPILPRPHFPRPWGPT